MPPKERGYLFDGFNAFALMRPLPTFPTDASTRPHYLALRATSTHPTTCSGKDETFPFVDLQNYSRDHSNESNRVWYKVSVRLVAAQHRYRPKRLAGGSLRAVLERVRD